MTSESVDNFKSPDERNLDSPTTKSTTSPESKTLNSYFQEVWLGDQISLADVFSLAFTGHLSSYTLVAIHTKSNEWSKRLDDTYTNLLKRTKLDKESRERFLKKIKLVEKREKMTRKWQEQNVVRLKDKIAFVVGVSNIFAAAYLLGRAPAWIPEWYTFWAVTLVSVRFLIYKSKSW
ncbi:hypothetical protein K7432_002428, partial [Basidiobolus ranarum]